MQRLGAKTTFKPYIGKKGTLAEDYLILYHVWKTGTLKRGKFVKGKFLYVGIALANINGLTITGLFSHEAIEQQLAIISLEDEIPINIHNLLGKGKGMKYMVDYKDNTNGLPDMPNRWRKKGKLILSHPFDLFSFLRNLIRKDRGKK